MCDVTGVSSLWEYILLLVRVRQPIITVVTLSEVSALPLPPWGGASAARGSTHEAVGRGPSRLRDFGLRFSSSWLQGKALGNWVYQ